MASVPTYRQKYILMAVQLHLFSHVRNYTDRRSWFPEIFLLLLTLSQQGFLLIAAALLVPGSELLIKNVGTNPTRAGILEVCRAMGADITYLNENCDSGEPTADLLVRTSTLHGTTVEGAIIPTLIDEIPMIAVMAAFAEGTTIIRDAAELKVKETDRIKTTTEGLLAMGVDVTPTDDGMIIRGGNPVHGGQINSYLDHRIAMAFSIAALAAEGNTEIQDGQCVDVSYPSFFMELHSLSL